MGKTFKVKNGPSVMELQEVVIGSMLHIAVRIREETFAGSGILVPMNLDDRTLECHVKDSLKGDVTPDFEFLVIPRNQVTEEGWTDLYLMGDVTGNATEKTWYGSLKVWPTADPTAGVTVFVIHMPFKYEATR